MVSKEVLLTAFITCIITAICISAIWIGIYYGVVKDDDDETPTSETVKATECLDKCEFHLVESIPENLTYPTGTKFMSTTDAWLKLIKLATSNIDITSYYWSLKPEDSGGYYDETANNGLQVFNSLIAAVKDRNLKLRITQNNIKNDETAYLSEQGLASVRSLDFPKLTGSGILHTKAWTVDGKHLYVGSANLDWRSLTQVKELGVAIYNCPCLAEDMQKMMDTYWAFGDPNVQLPFQPPLSAATAFNKENPMSVSLNDDKSAVFFSSAPPQMLANGREGDIDAILHVIRTAEKFIHISVMDYIPAILYAKEKNRYWGVIDEALREAAYRYVDVRLLISRWQNTKRILYPFLNSIADIEGGLPCLYTYNATVNKTTCSRRGHVKVKLFEVPKYGNQSQIPYARVNHNKYMVTEKAAYIGTSNWSGDYFVSTGGFGIVIQAGYGTNSSNIVNQVNEDIFLRDWNSVYSKSIYEYDINGELFPQIPKS
uniref:Phospholipase D3 n=1 Tax=Syphacia muris TaxID=451379 RepID=A0A0N5AJG4_9BILA